jgi:beta-lactamase class A
MRKKAFAAILALVFGWAASIQAAPDANPGAKIERLKHQIERIVHDKDGVVGVAVKHMETGQSLAINGEVGFPMASTFKVPILVELLFQVKDGRFRLDEEIEVQKSDQHLGSGMFSRLVMPGLKLSVLNAVHFMMMISDNSATDILLAKVGAERINVRLKGLGIDGISVNRSCQALITDLMAMENVAGREAFKAAIVQFGQDPQDQATPAAMAALLEKIFKKEIIDPESCDLIQQIMFKCETGAARIKGELPAGTPVAHKTGTVPGTVNDVGIITLPDGQGHVVLSVLTKEFAGEAAEVEVLIAKIARLVYDYFLFAN